MLLKNFYNSRETYLQKWNLLNICTKPLVWVFNVYNWLILIFKIPFIFPYNIESATFGIFTFIYWYKYLVGKNTKESSVEIYSLRFVSHLVSICICLTYHFSLQTEISPHPWVTFVSLNLSAATSHKSAAL